MSQVSHRLEYSHSTRPSVRESKQVSSDTKHRKNITADPLVSLTVPSS